MDISPLHDFVTSCIEHLKNTGTLSTVDFPNVATFHCIILKLKSVNTTIDLIRKVY